MVGGTPSNMANVSTYIYHDSQDINFLTPCPGDEAAYLKKKEEKSALFSSLYLCRQYKKVEVSSISEHFQAHKTRSKKLKPTDKKGSRHYNTKIRLPPSTAVLAVECREHAPTCGWCHHFPTRALQGISINGSVRPLIII